jgi:hypothetical protein
MGKMNAYAIVGRCVVYKSSGTPNFKNSTGDMLKKRLQIGLFDLPY